MYTALGASTEYISGLSGGRKVNVTGGTRVQLSSTEAPCNAIIIQALRSNVGNVAVGGSDVSISVGSENGLVLAPGQTITLNVNNITRIWIDAANNTEGVNYLLIKG